MKRILACAVAIAAVGFVAWSSPAHATTTSSSQPSTIESWSSCTASLCIDAPPEGPKGLDGSGGWGWNSVANAPVTSLTVGKAASFTVTVLQPAATPFCGSGDTLTITLTYSSQDFNLSATDSTGTTGTDPFDRGAVETFAYTGDFLCHADQSTDFTFTPLNPASTALVTVTVNIMDPALTTSYHQASETFPVVIVPAPVKHK